MVYDYYDLPFCKRGKKTKAKAENIGESLSGDATTASPYEVSDFYLIYATIDVFSGYMCANLSPYFVMFHLPIPSTLLLLATYGSRRTVRHFMYQKSF